MEAKEKIIVAIDTNDLGKAVELVNKLYPYVGGFKIGLEFITNAVANIATCNDAATRFNTEMLRCLFRETHGKLFWDGKFSDIPNTVAGASAALKPLGVKFFNVHASAGVHAIRAAALKKGDAKLLVVTVLTSLNFAELWAVGFGRCRNTNCKKYATTEWEEKFMQDLVLAMAKNAKGYGADGVICSPKELAVLKEHPILDEFLKVTPGVRPLWAAKGDQKRVTTPGEAIRAGADYLVIGRPITSPPAEIGRPVEAARIIIKEIEEAEIFLLNGKISVAKFEEMLPKICNRETSSNPTGWRSENPLYGHCAVVSLLAQDLFGGELLRISLEGTAFAEMKSHYYNVLPKSGLRDFTRTQFGGQPPDIFESQTRERSHLLSNPDTKKRFEILRTRFLSFLTVEKEARK